MFCPFDKFTLFHQAVAESSPFLLAFVLPAFLCERRIGAPSDLWVHATSQPVSAGTVGSQK
jgi:hypothetical protein